MAGYRALNEACKNFEEQLRQVSTELFSAKISETFEDGIAKKLNDLSLFTSKLRLLRAKTLALTQPQPEKSHGESTTLSDYGDAASRRLMEQLLVKSATQARAVKAMITAKDGSLDADMRERKEKILSALSDYSTKEETLQQLDTVLSEREERLVGVRRLWEQEVNAVRAMRGRGGAASDVDSPLYEKMSKRVTKLEMMRWLISRLAMPRSCGYDWLRDPQRRLAAIQMARKPHTVETFLNPQLEDR